MIETLRAGVRQLIQTFPANGHSGGVATVAHVEMARRTSEGGAAGSTPPECLAVSDRRDEERVPPRRTR